MQDTEKDQPSVSSASQTEFGRLLRLFLLAVSIWPAIPGLAGQTARADFAEIQKLFMRASEAEKAGDLDSATSDLQEILRRRPELAEIHNKLGFIYFVRSRYPEAAVAFQNALHLKPEFFPSNLGLGMALFRQSAFDEALPPLKKAYALNSTDPQAIFYLGSSFLSLERFEQAVPLFLQFVRISPTDQDGLYGLTLAAEKLYVESFVTLARLYPNSARAHQVQAQRLAASEKWDEAVAEFQKALTISPRLEQIHVALGDIYARRGLSAQAEAEYEKELETNPYDPLVRAGLERITPRSSLAISSTTLARPAVSQGDETPANSQIHILVQGAECMKALALMNSISDGDLSGPIPWQWRAKCLLQLSEFDSLLTVLSQVPSDDIELLYWKGLSMQELTSRTYDALKRIESDSARLHELAGRLAAEDDDEPTALRELRLAEERDPGLPGIHYAIGHILMRNRQLQQAADEFLAELKVDPYNPLVQGELGSTYLGLRDPNKATPLLEAALKRRPDLLDARRDLGRALGQKGDWELALAQFHSVAASNPTDYSIHMLMGDAYRKLGRMTEAEAEFAKGRELQTSELSRTQGIANKTLFGRTDPSSQATSAPK